MVKHTQTIRWQFAGELFECVWLFCGVDALRVNSSIYRLNMVKTFFVKEISFNKRHNEDCNEDVFAKKEKNNISWPPLSLKFKMSKTTLDLGWVTMLSSNQLVVKCKSLSSHINDCIATKN